MQWMTDVKEAGSISQSCRLVMPLNAKTTTPCLPMPQGATAESSCRFPAFSRSYIHIWYPKKTCPVILVGSTFASLFSTFCISACPPSPHASFGIFWWNLVYTCVHHVKGANNCSWIANNFVGTSPRPGQRGADIGNLDTFLRWEMPTWPLFRGFWSCWLWSVQRNWSCRKNAHFSLCFGYSRCRKYCISDSTKLFPQDST